jgi:hypothetical protein
MAAAIKLEIFNKERNFLTINKKPSFYFSRNTKIKRKPEREEIRMEKSDQGSD